MTEDLGLKLENLKVEDLGKAKRVTIDTDNTTIIEGAGTRGGVAVIKVGTATETEMKEKKARVEDAMHATKAAVEQGIVPGGGVGLLRASAALEEVGFNAQTEHVRGPRQVRRHRSDERGPERPDQRCVDRFAALTTEALVSEIPEKEKPAAAHRAPAWAWATTEGRARGLVVT